MEAVCDMKNLGITTDAHRLTPIGADSVTKERSPSVFYQFKKCIEVPNTIGLLKIFSPQVEVTTTQRTPL